MVLLGFGIAGGSGLPVVSPIVSLVAFLVGATVGRRMAGVFPARAVHLSRSMLIADLTMTLTRLAADSPLAGGDGEESGRRTVAVLAMLLGATAGALLLKVDLALVMGLACLLAILTWVTFIPAAATAERAGEAGVAL